MNNNNTSLNGFYAKHPVVCHLLLIIATALILVWAAMIFLNVWTHHGSTSTVPQVKNMSFATAAELFATATSP